MVLDDATDGFRTVYDDHPGAAGAGTAVLLHGWPGDRHRLATPTTVLWPEHDPLFPPAWSDRVGEFLADVEVRSVPGAGHFTPLEAPDAFAAAILQSLA
jgi:pimeloyl-ACP methyl ester carboxylesterase